MSQLAPARAEPDPRAAFRAGARAGVPFALAGTLLAISFGVMAERAGIGAVGAIVMSVVVFAGSSQFAVVGILIAGGGIGTAVIATGLVNSRFLPMGVSLAPHLGGGPLRRGLAGQAIVDASWALARQADGGVSRAFLFGCTAPQYAGWVGGTVIGALVGTGGLDPKAFGLDAIFPAFFLILLLDELRDPERRRLAFAGGLIALAAVPLLPAGVPVLVAALPALAGLTKRAST